jgi:hypothetical protein
VRSIIKAASFFGEIGVAELSRSEPQTWATTKGTKYHDGFSLPSFFLLSFVELRDLGG